MPDIITKWKLLSMVEEVLDPVYKYLLNAAMNCPDTTYVST
jgi:hypothetical protein